MINQGKLAVVLGIEVSELFDCGVQRRARSATRPTSTAARRGLQARRARHGAGQQVRQRARRRRRRRRQTGIVVNSGNKYETGQLLGDGDLRGRRTDQTRRSRARRRPTATSWSATCSTRCCRRAPRRSTRPGAALQRARPADLGRAPGPPDDGEEDDHRPRPPERAWPASSCSTSSSRRTTRASCRGTAGARPDALPRIYRLGGVVTPYAGSQRGASSRSGRRQADARPALYFGFGWGADMNGFAHQGAAARAAPNPVTYPFKSVRRQADDRQAAQRRAASTTSTSTASRTTALPRLDRGPAQASPATRSSTTWAAARRPTCRCGSGPTACRHPCRRSRARSRGAGSPACAWARRAARCCAARASRSPDRGGRGRGARGRRPHDRRCYSTDRPRDAGGGHRPRAPRPAGLARRELEAREGAQQAVWPRRAVAQAARRPPPRHRRPPRPRALGRG